jgi:hypothetical protein
MELGERKMEKPMKVIKLHVEKKKSFRILVLAEIIILLISVCGLFGKNKLYEFGIDYASASAGTYNENEIYIDESMVQNASEVEINFEKITLPAGSYNVKLRYTTDTDAVNICYVTDNSMSDKMLRTNGAQLFSGLHSTDYDMMILEKTSDLTVHVEYECTGSLTVQELIIQQNNKLNRCILFVILCICTLINAVYLYRQYDRVYGIPVQNKIVTFCLGAAIAAAAFPIIDEYMIPGGDLVYHLMRIEGIKDGILAGQFPIRISPEWQQGYGYASPIFYGETVLYIAALFRLIGFSVITSYRLFMFIIAAATVIIAYKCFEGIFHNKYTGVFCSMLYSVSVYRIYKTYFCGSWGETFGIMLLPLIAYGFYRVFTQDIHDKNYGKSWIPLTAGFTLLLQSHLLTCEITGLFTIILCVIMWKKVFRKETFTVLAKTVIYTILLSAWFLIPFADYMTTGDFVIHHVSGRRIQYRGLFPAHLLLTFFINGGNVFFSDEGMADSAATGVGIVLIIPLCILLYLFFAGKTKNFENKEKKLAVISILFAGISMLMSLCLFPWDQIQNINSLTATLVSSIQFPNRFLTIANLALTITAGIVAEYFAKKNDRVGRLSYFCGILLLVVLGNVYLMESGINKSASMRIYNSEGMGTGYISGAEYLPYGTAAEKLMYHNPICYGYLETENYEKLSLGAKVHVVNNDVETGQITFALLYYKGYMAYDEDTGTILDCYAGDNNQVAVDIPAGFNGNVRVKFVSPIYWRIGELITLATILIFVYFGIVDKKRNDKNLLREEI